VRRSVVSTAVRGGTDGYARDFIVNSHQIIPCLVPCLDNLAFRIDRNGIPGIVRPCPVTECISRRRSRRFVVILCAQLSIDIKTINRQTARPVAEGTAVRLQGDGNEPVFLPGRFPLCRCIFPVMNRSHDRVSLGRFPSVKCILHLIAFGIRYIIRRDRLVIAQIDRVLRIAGQRFLD